MVKPTSEREQIQAILEKFFANHLKTSKVITADINPKGVGLSVNGTEVGPDDWTELTAGDNREAAKFRVRVEGTEVVATLESKSTGEVEKRISIQEGIVLTFQTGEFRLAPSSITVTIGAEELLTVDGQPKRPGDVILLGPGKLRFTHDSGEIWGVFSHPEAQAGEELDPKSGTRPLLSGTYTLFYNVGLVTVSHLSIQRSGEELTLNGQKVSYGEALPFHVDTGSEVWIAKDRDGIVVCYGFQGTPMATHSDRLEGDGTWTGTYYSVEGFVLKPV